MDIILHIGAHRTATTSFQFYLRANRDVLTARQLGFWGPWRTRNGLLHGVADRPESEAKARRAVGRVQLAVENARRSGTQRLLVSDENMLGSARRCLRSGMLYPGAGERVARLAQAFGHVRSIHLQLRAQDLWWASVIGYLIPRGEGVPTEAQLATLAASPRSWRDVIMDIACACPEAEITVTPFERFADRPDRLLAMMTGMTALPPAASGHYWRNRRLDLADLRRTLADRDEDPGRLPEGEGRFMPFTDRQRAALREAYADDLFWLEAGAEGLATLKSDADPAQPRAFALAGPRERGHAHERRDRRPARGLARDR